MREILTVGKLKSVIADLPDDLEVKLSSDTGVYQGQIGGRIVVEDARRVKCETSHFKYDYLDIYVNEIEDDDWEDD